MSNPVLHFDEQSIPPNGFVPGRTYKLRFFIDNLTEKSILYSVKDENKWTQITKTNFANGKWNFIWEFEAEEGYGNILLTFALFIHNGNKLSCWLAEDIIHYSEDGKKVQIINNINADNAGAIYIGEQNYNFDKNNRAAMPQPMEFAPKEDYERYLPYGRCSKTPSAKWKITFPDGKETVLLTSNSIMVGRSGSHDIHFKPNALPKETKEKYEQVKKDEVTIFSQLHLYNTVTSRANPLKITITKDNVQFKHLSDRRITLDGYPLKEDKEMSVPHYFPHVLLFEQFLQLVIEQTEERFSYEEWSTQTTLPQNVLDDLFHDGQHPLPCESLPPMHFTTSEEHPVTEENSGNLNYLKTFVETEGSKYDASSFEFFKQHPANLWHFRDYYFTGDGFIWTLPDGTEAQIMNAGGHLYILFPKQVEYEFVNNGFPFYPPIHPHQPVLLQNGMTVRHCMEGDENVGKGERIFTVEQI